MLGRVPAAHRRLLRLSGTARVALAPPAGITITERVVYDSAPLDMPDALAEILAKPAVVLLHSAEAARHLAAECDRIGTDRASLALAAIGPRVATAAGDGWAFVVVSAQPNEAALLALAGEMCQGHGRSQTGAT